MHLTSLIAASSVQNYVKFKNSSCRKWPFL